MVRTKIRAVTVAALAAGSLMLVASPALATTDTGGSLTITADNTFVSQAANAGITFSAVSPATSSYSNGVLTFTLPVTGGNADANKATGTLQLGGGLKMHDDKTETSLTFSALNLSFDTGAFNGTPSEGGTSPVALADAGGSVLSSSTSTTQTLSASMLTVDAQGASFANTNLRTTFFTAGQNTGSLTTTFTYTP